jgi:phenylalanine-4-hydroxylase
MAVGKKVVSAFSGPADVNSFDLVTHVPSSKTIKAKKSAEREELEGLYLNVRDIREGKGTDENLGSIFASVKERHGNDWLLSVEIVEQAHKNNNQELQQEVMLHLDAVKKKRPEVAHLIDGGLELIFEKEKVS